MKKMSVKDKMRGGVQMASLAPKSVGPHEDQVEKQETQESDKPLHPEGETHEKLDLAHFSSPFGVVAPGQKQCDSDNSKPESHRTPPIFLVRSSQERRSLY